MSIKRGTSHARLLKLYHQRAKRWGEYYLLKQLWRIGAMYDLEDVRQDAFEIWTRVYRRHARKGTRWTPEPDLFRIYKQAMWGRITNRSRQCFPNTFAYAAERGKVVKDIEGLEESLAGGTNLSDCMSKSYSDDLDGDLDHSLAILDHLIKTLPTELAEVLWVLVHDFCGKPCIERRERKRLSGTSKPEPLRTALARYLDTDPTRDLIAELASELGREKTITSKRGV